MFNRLKGHNFCSYCGAETVSVDQITHVNYDRVTGKENVHHASMLVCSYYMAEVWREKGMVETYHHDGAWDFRDYYYERSQYVEE